MKTRTRILLLILGLGVFLYLILDFGIENILLNLRRTGWWFAPVVLVWGVVYWMNAKAWYLVLRTDEPDPGFAAILRLTITGFAINYITPFLNLGGEPYRVIALRESVGLPRAASSVILYYITRVLGHCFFWLGWIILMVFSVELSLQGLVLFGLFFVAVAGAIVFFFARYRKGIFASLLAWLPRVPLLRRLQPAVERRRASLLEIDEHSADVGAITRLEAFLDSLQNVTVQPAPARANRTRTASRSFSLESISRKSWYLRASGHRSLTTSAAWSSRFLSTSHSATTCSPSP